MACIVCVLIGVALKCKSFPARGSTCTLTAVDCRRLLGFCTVMLLLLNCVGYCYGSCGCCDIMTCMVTDVSDIGALALLGHIATLFTHCAVGEFFLVLSPQRVFVCASALRRDSFLRETSGSCALDTSDLRLRATHNFANSS